MIKKYVDKNGNEKIYQYDDKKYHRDKEIYNLQRAKSYYKKIGQSNKMIALENAIQIKKLIKKLKKEDNMDEKTKQELLEELRKEYTVTLKPLTESQFSVKDIIDKYWGEFEHLISGAQSETWTSWKKHNAEEQFGAAIRRVMCLKYGVWNIREIPYEDRAQFRADLEKFIKEFILGGK